MVMQVRVDMPWAGIRLALVMVGQVMAVQVRVCKTRSEQDWAGQD